MLISIFRELSAPRVKGLLDLPILLKQFLSVRHTLSHQTRTKGILRRTHKVLEMKETFALVFLDEVDKPVQKVVVSFASYSLISPALLVSVCAPASE